MGVGNWQQFGSTKIGTSFALVSSLTATESPTKQGAAPTYYLAKFSWKLHENGENWTGGRPKFYYVDPPLTAVPFKINSERLKKSVFGKALEINVICPGYSSLQQKHSCGRHSPGRQPPPQQTATAADGTHPTGMHSCFFNICLIPIGSIQGRIQDFPQERASTTRIGVRTTILSKFPQKSRKLKKKSRGGGPFVREGGCGEEAKPGRSPPSLYSHM